MTKTKKVRVDWNAMTAAMIEPASVLNGRNSETLQLRVHKVLIAIAADWIATTDQKTAVERVNFQLDQLSDGLRKNAIVTWVTSPKHFGMVYNDETKVIAAGKTKVKSLDMPFLKNSHWWLFTKEPAFKVHDLPAKITKLVVEATNAAKKDDKRNVIPAEILTALRAVDAMTVTS